MTILFTICGRAGSKGFKNKNLKEMNGVPLVYYTLAVIEEYKEKHKDHNVLVAVNTDSKELQEVIKKQVLIQNIIFINRKAELAGDTVGKVDVIQDTYQYVKGEYSIDLVVDLDITSPLRRECDLENVIREVVLNPDLDLAFSVVEARRNPYFNMVEKKEDGYYRKICLSKYTSRQQAPASYEMNASIYAYNPSFLEAEINKTILDYKCGIAIMPDYLVLDIDSETDFRMMQVLHTYFCKEDEGLNEIYQLTKQM